MSGKRQNRESTDNTQRAEHLEQFGGIPGIGPSSGYMRAAGIPQREDPSIRQHAPPPNDRAIFDIFFFEHVFDVFPRSRT